MGRYTSGGVGRDVLAGAVAGGAAVWLISKMDWSLHHSGQTKDPANVAAARAADKAGVAITDRQEAAAAKTVHYGVGIGLGALYGLLRGMAPSVTTGRGSVYGVAAFILGDEIGVPAMGLAKGPLEYAARDHAKSALAHVVFGLATDLGTRLISPWKSDVVLMRGPSLQERLDEGRQSIADGRDYLQEQGRYAVEQGRSYLDRGRDLAADYAEQAREQAEAYDLPGRAERGRKRVRRFAEDLRSQLPDRDDVADAIDEGRKRARRFAGDVASRLPDRDDLDDAVETGRTQARRWWQRAAETVPDRGDVRDALDEGRQRGRTLAKRARERLPDRDDLDDMTRAGRKRASRMADDARDGGSSLIDRAGRWLFG